MKSSLSGVCLPFLYLVPCLSKQWNYVTTRRFYLCKRRENDWSGQVAVHLNETEVSKRSGSDQQSFLLMEPCAWGLWHCGKVRWPTKTWFQIDKPLCFYLSKLSTEELLKTLYKVYWLSVRNEWSKYCIKYHPGRFAALQSVVALR